MAKMF